MSRIHYCTILFFTCLLINACVAPLAVPPTATTDAATDASDAACIEHFDPTVDYFPAKATLTHTSGFAIEYHNSYKLLTLATPYPGGAPMQYVLVQCGAPVPEGYAESQIVSVPVRSIVTMSTTFLTALTELGVLDRLVGLDELTYVSNPAVLEMAAAGKLTQLGVGAGVNVEQALDLHPDLILTTSTGSTEFDAYPKLIEAGLKVVLDAEWLDVSPLGRAEWSKYIAAFFDREAVAEEIFTHRVKEYDRARCAGRDGNNATDRLCEHLRPQRLVDTGRKDLRRPLFSRRWRTIPMGQRDHQ